MPERHAFRFGSQELTPTLEEYAQISGLSLSGPYTRVTIDHMRRQFLSTTRLTLVALLSKVTIEHIVFLEFMIDKFGLQGSYATFRDDSDISEDRWQVVHVDALMMCVISFLYMPIYMDHMDVGVVMTVQALHEDHTILPIILAETYISASYCHSFRDREFRGSFILLYV